MITQDDIDKINDWLIVAESTTPRLIEKLMLIGRCLGKQIYKNGYSSLIYRLSPVTIQARENNRKRDVKGDCWTYEFTACIYISSGPVSYQVARLQAFASDKFLSGLFRDSFYIPGMWDGLLESIYQEALSKKLEKETNDQSLLNAWMEEVFKTATILGIELPNKSY
jgi:hypothetical protein